MNPAEHVANRVVVSAAAGGLWGYMQASVRGHLQGPSARLTALSCGIVGLVCFSAERLAFSGITRVIGTRNESIPRLYVLLASHSIAGTAAGALLGTIYQRRPINGIILCLPLMTLYGYGESKFQDLVDERKRKAGIVPS